jgi:hypothetical protein
VRELKETDPVVIRQETEATLAGVDLKRYAGTYAAPLGGKDTPLLLAVKGDRLQFSIPMRHQTFDLVPHSASEFSLRTTDARLLFDLGPDGIPRGFAFSVAGDTAFTAKRSK